MSESNSAELRYFTCIEDRIKLLSGTCLPSIALMHRLLYNTYKKFNIKSTITDKDLSCLFFRKDHEKGTSHVQ